MAVTVFKSIKPKRFKDEEFARIIRNSMRRVGRGMVKDSVSVMFMAGRGFVQPCPA